MNGSYEYRLFGASFAGVTFIAWKLKRREGVGFPVLFSVGLGLWCLLSILIVLHIGFSWDSIFVKTGGGPLLIHLILISMGCTIGWDQLKLGFFAQKEC